MVFLAKSRCEPEHQLDTFHLVHPIAECGVEFFSLGCENTGRAKRTKVAEGQGAITVDRTITNRGAPFVIFCPGLGNLDTEVGN